MRETETERMISPKSVGCYEDYLREQEKSPSTIRKYTHDLKALLAYLPDGKITKTALICWKELLTERYAAASVNVMLAAVNGFLEFLGWQDCKVKPLRIQREIFCNEEKELTQAEYTRLVRTASDQGDGRLGAVLQTICATGIRVSELRFITVEAVYSGKASVNCKGKRRTVFLPDKLRSLLRNYIRRQKRTEGAVFVTKGGKPLDRSNIWRDMKGLCQKARVLPSKVFPHNLRHLFARIYYAKEKDLSRLADILGHTNVNTTRIYTVESGKIHSRQLARMGLVIT